jgi:hypothetical protein
MNRSWPTPNCCAGDGRGGLGLRELLDTCVDLGQAPGRANVADKALPLVQWEVGTVVLPAEDGRRRRPPAGQALYDVEESLAGPVASVV